MNDSGKGWGGGHRGLPVEGCKDCTVLWVTSRLPQQHIMKPDGESRGAVDEHNSPDVSDWKSVTFHLKHTETRT